MHSLSKSTNTLHGIMFIKHVISKEIKLKVFTTVTTQNTYVGVMLQ